jgi:ketosteroid isomerase-like protein
MPTAIGRSKPPACRSRRCRRRTWRSRGASTSLNAGDLSQLPEFVAPEIEVDLTRNVFNPQVIRGYEGIEQFGTTLNEVWEDFRFEVEELIDAGDEVVAALRLVGNGRGSGVPVDRARHPRRETA